jgi:hypothetical protein
MKIYKISYNINQNDILASKLSKEIFFVVQGNMRNNAYKEISVDNICKLHINTFNNTQGQLRYGTFDISASFDFAINDIYPP